MWNDNEIDTLFSAVFHRKSVRKFTGEPLGEELLNSIKSKAETLYRPDGDEKSSFRILGAKEAKGIVSAKAPHFLTLYADNPESIISASFVMQQIDLWLSSQGLGSCWLGMPHPVSELAEYNGYPYVIMLAFGKPSESAHRTEVTQFKRKLLSEITDLAGCKELLEPVRLAPSATNGQPWFLTGDESSISLHGKLNGFITRKLYGDMSHVDMGIALCHLWLSAVKEKRFSHFEYRNEITVPKGYRYIRTLCLKEKAGPDA